MNTNSKKILLGGKRGLHYSVGVNNLEENHLFPIEYQQLQLHKALELVETLKSENENKERMLTEMSANTDETESSIREKLKKNVLGLLKATKNNTDSLATIKEY